MSNTTSFTPAAPPPLGETSDPLHPKDVGHTATLVVTAICTAVVNVLFIIHAYVKLRLKQGKLLAEDSAWIFTNALSGCGLTFKPMISRGVKVFICTLALAYLPVQGLKTFICTPIAAFWEPTYTDVETGENPYCLDQSRLFMCDISIAIVTDLIILVLPIPLVWEMRAPRRQKVKMIILLGAGGAATAATVVRAYLNSRFMYSKNVSADFALIIITTILELSIGFACVCLLSAKFALDRATSSLDHPDQNWFGRERPAGSDRKSGSSVSTYWESIRSKLTMTTRPGSTIAGGLQSSRASRPWTRGRDIELGFSSEPVVFQQRLEVPSLRSTSDARSCTSRGGDHRGLSDAEFAHCMEEVSSQKGEGDDLADSRKDSIINLETEQ
ncbi:integral membrane protein [Diaporthe eres]|nr:integral membrane protein [Diaporthe eres]